MENNNLPVISKRIWGMVRIVYLMLRKGIISKRKLLLDLNMMMKRGKIAGKAISNLMFHHHFNATSSSTSSKEYEFSCSNTPNYFPFHLNKRRHNHHHHHHGNFFACAQHPQTLEFDDDVATANALKSILEILNNHEIVEASPALPGFGKSPMVRQLRVTDSPFPLRDIEDNTQVDEAAEDFINRFYKDLRLQKY